MSKPVCNHNEDVVPPSASVTEVATNTLTAAINTLYRDHHNWLFAWLRKKLNCQHQAADIAHDTFARILSLSHLPCLLKPRAYLVTTAKHLLIDQSRRQRIEQAYLAEVAGMSEAMGKLPSTEDIVSAIQILDKISQALTSLAEKPRKAFLLHYLDGLNQTAIAEELGVSDRMVRKYLAQALVHCYLFHASD